MAYKKVSGFTLIELIVVIAILGILAAVAIPRFINATSKARIAALNGLAGALNSAVELAQSEYLLEAVYTTPITMNTVPVIVSAGGATNGIPTAAAGGIGSALQTLSGFTYDPATGIFAFSPAVASCNVTYAVPSATTYTVTLVTTGC